MAKKKSTAKSRSAAAKKAAATRKAKAAKVQKPYTGPAVAIEEGVRVEGAKRLDPVPTADRATGSLIDPEGKIKPQKVGA